VIRDAVDFVRSYADKFHHAKEEEILFKCFDEKLDILQVMLGDHETGRAHVRAVLEAVEKRDRAHASEHLNGYRELLTEHIKKEDEILYPWMDRELSDRQIGQLFSQFNETDETFGDAPKKYENFISKLEEQFA
jgi:hemerythrin-like domain-containing protein